MAAVVRRTFRTMDSLALNSEQWAWIIICAACVGTVALLLACWMQEEAPEPHPWLISPPKVPVPLPDLEIESGISAQARERAEFGREKDRTKSQIGDLKSVTSHEYMASGTGDTAPAKAPLYPAKCSVFTAASP